MPSADRRADPTLGELFLGAARAVRRRWVAALAPWDLPPHQARALRVVGDLEPVRPGVLAERLHIAPRSVTDVVDALDERGLLTREADPSDRRATVLRLTDEGWRIRRAIQSARRDEADEYFAVLSEEDRATLLRILHELEESSRD
ncbi:putative MarR-family transcriptional regulator [Nostocoides japonicum T1-X7]|uniref:Putative MarR-family transcriptional regulator n=1 Tax=Nostocoides japonicum T1-X7 TaxID=1194083 RepID=A0A077LTL9_9MICO|nr:MarR family winged helix-turn-helix transcriptional regulator [Tetrasphaera japonica]CCH76621.1 putative MarR-family transcriptional regulator [Tetrasphaera japonica T1-X7]